MRKISNSTESGGGRTVNLFGLAIPSCASVAVPSFAAIAFAAAFAAGCATTDSDDAGFLFRERRLSASNATFGEDGTPIPSGANEIIESSLPVITGEISIADAVNLALANNLDIRSAFLMRDEAEGAVVEAKAAAYPHITLGGGANSDMAERGDNPDTYSATWSVTQPLWHSGAVSAGLRYAELYKASTDEVIREKVQNTIYDVVSGYYAVLLSRQMVDVYSEAVGVAERMLDTEQKKYKSGTASHYEVLRAEVEVATTRAELIKEQNAFRTACVNFIHRIGVGQDSSVTFSDALVYVAETNDYAALVSSALMHRPDILQAEAAVRMAQESLAIAKSDYGPTADLYLKGEFANPDPNDRSKDEWNHDWSAGVQVSYKLFDGMARKGAVARAEAKLRQAKTQLRNTEESARVDVVRAMLDVRNAEELFRSQSKNIELSREALRILESGHKVGRNTQIEVLDARSALTEATGRYYNAVYAHEVARLAVKKAAGTLGFDALKQVRRGSVVSPEAFRK